MSISSLASHVLSGFGLGLTTGPFCLAACFPVLLSFVLGDRPYAPKETWCFVGRFIAGRFAAYMTLGIVSATVGAALGVMTFKICGCAWIILSACLIAHGLGLTLPHVGLCRQIGRHPGNKSFPYVVGGLTALNVCPPILLAITYSLKSGSPIAGVAVFGSFFVATSLFILPAGFVGYLQRVAFIAWPGRLLAVVVGIVFLWQGFSLLVGNA